MFSFFSKKESLPNKPFSCKRDNLTIRGLEYRLDDSPRQIAIVSHGFMANHTTVLEYVRQLTKLGYVTYCFDFNGGSAMKNLSDGKTTDMSVLTEIEDLKAVLDYALSLPNNLKDEPLLMGCSQGGFVSAITASSLKDQIKDLVLFYPALCIPDDARSGKMMFAKFDPHNPPETLKCGPMLLGKRYVNDVINIDPYNLIKDFPGNILIIHGTNDKIVNINYSKQAYEIYNNMTFNRKLQFHIIENGDHGFKKKHNKIAIHYLKDFLK